MLHRNIAIFADALELARSESYSWTFPWISWKEDNKTIYIPALSLPIHIFRISKISFQLWATL